jgi:hypothetical protein
MNESPPQKSATSPRPGLLRRWWRAATRPIEIDEERSIFRQRMVRILLWLPVVVPLLAIMAFATFHFATVWRAHRLAAGAMESARAGALVKARLQAMSASNLRKNDPEVRRVMVFVLSKMNAPGASEQWTDLSNMVDLTAEEAEEFATVAMLFGTAEQFDRAHTLLEQAGDPAKAASLRSARDMRSGNVAKSVEGARAAAASGDSAMKLSLARLLVARHGPALLGTREPKQEDVEGAAEAAALIEQLRGTPQASEALALGLALLPVSMDQARSWAEEALENPDPSSSALIPAAQFMVETRAVGVQEMIAKLSPVFAQAGAEQRAAFAQWLNRNGHASDTLALLTAEDAAANPHAYAARAMALANLGQWDALLAMTEEQTKVPESLRLTSRALASSRLGRVDLVPGLLAEAIAAGARDRRLKETLLAVDQMDGRTVADDTLLGLCSDADLAGVVFPVARDRFTRAGQLDSRQQAWELASAAAPDAPAVKDYRRRSDLLAKRTVDLRETAAAMRLGDPTHRFTHALAQLRQNPHAEALETVRGTGLRPDELTPADLAVLAAVLSANGLDEEAAMARALIRPGTIGTEEASLLGALN